jgi:hypothetical protein
MVGNDDKRLTALYKSESNSKENPVKRLLAQCVAIIMCFNHVASAQPPSRQNNRQPKAVAKQTKQESTPLNILSIIPAQAEPGMVVTINGTGFDENVSAYLGSNQLPTRVTGATILSFDIPQLPPGLYALFIRRTDGTVSKVYNFSVLPPKPTITSLSPDRINSCSSASGREVSIVGKSFRTGAQVIFDGAAIPAKYVSPELISFAAPTVIGGLHQIQVRNPEDTISGATGLFIDTKPEIINVRAGNEAVNYYELLIDGRNFLQGSALVIDGKRLTIGSATSQNEREKLIYNGCEGLVYLRYPYDSSPKTIRLQVVNPNGEESGIFTITAP